MANNGHRTGTLIKRINCPHCSRKKGGRRGKIEIQIGINNQNEWSGTKMRTCPVCRQNIRFGYNIDGNGKVKIKILD